MSTDYIIFLLNRDINVLFKADSETKMESNFLLSPSGGKFSQSYDKSKGAFHLPLTIQARLKLTQTARGAGGGGWNTHTHTCVCVCVYIYI